MSTGKENVMAKTNRHIGADPTRKIPEKDSPPSARRAIVLGACAHLSLDPHCANHPRAPTIGSCPDGLKALKTLIKRDRKKPGQKAKS
jgi:hypothetical protein